MNARPELPNPARAATAARALRILLHYRARSLRRTRSLQDYIETVSRRLQRFGIRRIPQSPVAFLAFCQELGLFKTPRSMRHNPKGS